MCTGVNNGTLEKPVLNQFRKLKDALPRPLKQTAILRGNKGRVKIDPVFIRNIIVDEFVKIRIYQLMK